MGTVLYLIIKAINRHLKKQGHPPKAVVSKKNQFINGFTLVELIVVIVIIGVISAVAIPTYTTQTKRTQTNKDLQTLKEMNLITLNYISFNNKIPNVNQALSEINTSYGGIPISAFKEPPYLATNGTSFNNCILTDPNQSTTQQQSSCLDSLADWGWWYDKNTALFSASPLNDEGQIESDTITSIQYDPISNSYTNSEGQIIASDTVDANPEKYAFLNQYTSYINTNNNQSVISWTPIDGASSYLVSTTTTLTSAIPFFHYLLTPMYAANYDCTSTDELNKTVYNTSLILTLENPDVCDGVTLTIAVTPQLNGVSHPFSMTGKIIIDRTLPPVLTTNNVSSNSNGQFTIPYSSGDFIEFGVKSNSICSYEQQAQSENIILDTNDLTPGDYTLCFKITDQAGNIQFSELSYTHL